MGIVNFFGHARNASFMPWLVGGFEEALVGFISGNVCAAFPSLAWAHCPLNKLSLLSISHHQSNHE
jgi:hypothetical protein